MSPYTQTVKRREETRGKIRMIMEAADRPIKISEITAHPTATEIKSQTVSLFLRNMKGVKFNKKDKTWTLDKTEIKSKRPYKKRENNNNNDKPMTFSNAQFLIKSNGDLFLSIGDISLPVGFE